MGFSMLQIFDFLISKTFKSWTHTVATLAFSGKLQIVSSLAVADLCVDSRNEGVMETQAMPS